MTIEEARGLVRGTKLIWETRKYRETCTFFSLDEHRINADNWSDSTLPEGIAFGTVDEFRVLTPLDEIL